MSARAPYHMDASDTVIYVCQKAQTVPGKGKATPVGIPCVRPQSDMKCYMLDLCGIESGSWQSFGPTQVAKDRMKILETALHLTRRIKLTNSTCRWDSSWEWTIIYRAPYLLLHSCEMKQYHHSSGFSKHFWGVWTTSRQSASSQVQKNNTCILMFVWYLYFFHLSYTHTQTT